MPPFTVLRQSATAQYFTEPLEGLGDLIPLEMILIPGGIFLMGSPDTEPERSEDEGPQHEVTVSNFFMGRFSVTQAQWRLIASLPQVNRKLAPEPSHFTGDNRPVEQISWYEAVEFCDRLAAHTSRPYRLPTEAEWEYACRAGKQTPFYFGKTLTPELANYNGEYIYDEGPKGEYRQETTPVNYLGIGNAFGLCEMHGNVFEWCQDSWHESYEGAPTDGSAWLSENEESSRIIRGGSWIDFPRLCRSAFRGYDGPVNRLHHMGFRVVCRAPRTL
ncbi:MAG: formylglycine-generating enzyme family protein [Leptolyngbyaceae cyanobacterium MO_188.B28]|nr:formylglycine-generating enzyme family protein [Leptolyngbyaceae cyanobacterium MO_188.B28]